ncbi:hypothetical protein GZL_04999 [Streptomyces sp. 769]|nr:hypothetical protein GZL_04999 [Streptomyces sp. 769]
MTPPRAGPEKGAGPLSRSPLGIRRCSDGAKPATARRYGSAGRDIRGC